LALVAELRYRLYSVLVTDALSEYSYDAELAGLVYSFEASSLGFYVSVSGYNDKLHVLLRDVLEKAKRLEVRADRLEVMIEKVNNTSWIPSGTRLMRLLPTDQTRLGELFPRPNISIIGLLLSIPYDREAVDSSRETTSS